MAISIINAGSVPNQAAGSQFGMVVNPDGSINIGSMPAISVSTTTGSQSFLYGISGGTWMPLSVQSGTEAVLRTTASVTLNELSVSKDTTPTTGSPTFIGGQFNGSLAGFRLEAGSNLMIGSVRIISDPLPISGGVIIRAGSVQIYNPLGIGSVRIAEQGLTLAVSGLVNIGNIGSVAITSLPGGSVAITTNPVSVSGIFRTIPSYVTGSVLANGGTGSSALVSLLNEVRWVAVSGTNAGSTYAMQIRDGQGFLIQSYLQKTGNSSTLTNFIISGIIIVDISGTQASGLYPFRVGYI